MSWVRDSGTDLCPLMDGAVPLVSGYRVLGAPDLVPVHWHVIPDPGDSVGGAISRVSCEFEDFRAACPLDMSPSHYLLGLKHPRTGANRLVA